VYKPGLQDMENGSQQNSDMKNFQLLFQSQADEQHQQQSDQVDDFDEEGDDEFEGEHDTTSNGLGEDSSSAQNITIVPELPEASDYYEDNSTSYYENSDHDQILGDIGTDASNSSTANNQTTGNVAMKNGQTAERKFKCNVCEAAFMSNVNLQR
jgi:hypothetical protein